MVWILSIWEIPVCSLWQRWSLAQLQRRGSAVSSRGWCQRGWRNRWGWYIEQGLFLFVERSETRRGGVCETSWKADHAGIMVPNWSALCVSQKAIRTLCVVRIIYIHVNEDSSYIKVKWWSSTGFCFGTNTFYITHVSHLSPFKKDCVDFLFCSFIYQWSHKTVNSQFGSGDKPPTFKIFHLIKCIEVLQTRDH